MEIKELYRQYTHGEIGREELRDLYERHFLGITPKPTSFQKQIEGRVTNGLGCNTATQYVFKSNHGRIIFKANDADIHDTIEGLRIHLMALDNKINPHKRLRRIIRRNKVIAIDMAEMGMRG